MMSPVVKRIFMLGSPLLMCGKLTNPRTGMDYGKDLRQKTLKAMSIPINCYGSSKSNLEANVV